VKLDNVVKCSLPESRGTKKPKKEEIVECAPYLLYNILATRPKIIVAMGSPACETLYPGWAQLPAGKIGKLKTYRGFPQQRRFFFETPTKVYEHTAWVLPTYQPSSCLREWQQDDLVIRDLQNAQQYAKGIPALVMPDTKVTVVKTFSDAMALIAKLHGVKAFETDCETTGLSPHTDRILCIGFCWKEGEAHVLPLLQKGALEFWTPDEYKQITQALQDVFLSCELRGQGLKFDTKMFRALTGVAQYNIGFDTLVAHHCIDENKPHNLAFLVQYYLGWDKYDTAAHSIKRKDGDGPDMAALENEVLWQYLGYDVDGPHRLRKLFLPILKRENLQTVFRLEIDLIDPIVDMEYRGVRVNVPHLQQKAEDARKLAGDTLLELRGYAKRLLGRDVVESMKPFEIREKAKELIQGDTPLETDVRLLFSDPKLLTAFVLEHVGTEISNTFNPNSRPQLTKLLKSAGADLKKKTPTGSLQVNVDVLSALAMKDDPAGRIAKLTQVLRSATKLLSTYIDGSSLKGAAEGIVFEGAGEGGLLSEVGSHSRTHANYNISRTVTGRLSAQGAALTMPKKGGIRDAIVPDD